MPTYRDAFTGLCPGLLPAGPAALLQLTHAAWLFVGGLWLLRQLQRTSAKGPPAGKLLVMGSTWLSWYVGIVAYNSDVAFSLLNVPPHGIPTSCCCSAIAKVSLLSVIAKTDPAERANRGRLHAPPRPQTTLTAIVLFLLPLMGLAFVEEGCGTARSGTTTRCSFPCPSSSRRRAAGVLGAALCAAAVDALSARCLDLARRAEKPDLRRRLGL